MTIAQEKPQAPQTIAHPLEPLTPTEIETAVATLRNAQSLGDSFRFATVTLREPAKETVLAFQPGDPVQRQAFLILLDNATGKTYEADVDLGSRTVTRWEHIPGVQPSIMLDEFLECENAVKANPDFQAAIAKRGITDPSLVMVDPWSAGNYGL
ncbi:MAG: tyramine oxidase, partial [Cyanobacteria bacterium P01_A01_bin.135]